MVVDEVENLHGLYNQILKGTCRVRILYCICNNPKNGSLTTEFTEIKDRIGVCKVFLSHLFGYYSMPCYLFNNHGVFSVRSVVNAFFRIIGNLTDSGNRLFFFYSLLKPHLDKSASVNSDLMSNSINFPDK